MVPNVTGNITVNGLTDKEMAKIWEMKAKHGDSFTFVPNMVVVAPNQQRPGHPGPAYPFTTYDNVQFTWKDEMGMGIVHEVMTYLLKKDEQAVAAQAQ